MFASKQTLYIFLLQVVAMQLLLANPSPSQTLRETKVSIHVNNVELVEVFEVIEKQTSFVFTYPNSFLNNPKRYSFEYEQVSLVDVLLELAEKEDLRFKRVNSNISVIRTPKSAKPIERVLELERTIRGSVKDRESGKALIGATVRVKGANIGTVTDIEGNFTLSVPEDAQTIIISYVGYVSEEVDIRDKNVINISMSPDLTALEELVVIGYGEQREDLLVSNIEKLKGNEFKNQTNINANQAIQGRLPGVFVTNSGGAPGGNTQVIIRGLSSINAGNAPLYVVDGVPITAGTFETNQAAPNLDILSLVNPMDITSIEVLKDAAAKAVYGSRAANGAILITTKSGQGQEQKVSFSTQQGISTAMIPYDLLNTEQYLQLVTESYTNDGLEIPENIQNIDPSINTDWLDLILRDARFQEYQLNLSKASEDISYYISASYRNEEGIIETNNLERSTIRLNLDLPLSKKVKFGTRTSLGVDNGNQMFGGYNGSGSMGYFTAVTMPTYLTPRDSEGEYIRNPHFFNPPNPIAIIEEREYETKTFKLISNNHVVWDIASFLTFRADFSYDLTTYRENFFDTENTNTWFPESLRRHYYLETTTYTIEPQMNFSQNWGVHSLTATLGGTIQEQDQFYESIAGSNFPSNNTTYLNSANDIFTFGPVLGNRLSGSNTEGYSFSSFFSRVNYDFDEKYLFSATFRRDGSSRFAPKTRYGNFWSLGAGWIFSKEPFMSNLSFLNFGKLRTSYGVTGNDQIGNYPYIGYWEAGTGFFNSPTVVASQLENEDLKWEEVEDFDIGVELGLLNNKFRLGIAYFNSLSKDLLLNRPLPYTTGFVDYFENIGSVRNKGWEFDINANLIQKSDWQWQIGGNLTSSQNSVEELVTDDPIIFNPLTAVTANIVGQPVNSFYNRVFEKIDPETGDIVWEDLNGDGIINLDDRAVIGDPNPRLFGGFYTSISWKNFRLDANFSFVKDVDIYDLEMTYSYRYINRYGANARSELLDRWQKPGDQTDMARMTQLDVLNGWQQSYIKDGSYIRMRNITLSYQIPANVLSPVRLSNASIYFTGVNLWTITGLEGVEPEQDGSGVNFFDYPQTKQFIMGLNLQF